MSLVLIFIIVFGEDGYKVKMINESENKEFGEKIRGDQIVFI